MRVKTLRAVGLCGLIGAMGLAACLEQSAPTTPSVTSQASAEEPSPVARMPIVRVVRRTSLTSPTPTPTGGLTTRTPTQTKTPAPTETETPTPTVTPTRTVTPTTTPAFTVIRLRAVSWQWDFLDPTAQSGPPYPGLNTITLKKGKLYEIHIFNEAPAPIDPNTAPHTFSGVPGLGLSAATLEYEHANESIQQFTPQSTGSFIYNCGDTNCSIGEIARQHDQMFGTINVVP